jgi:hypothetical protein
VNCALESVAGVASKAIEAPGPSVTCRAIVSLTGELPLNPHGGQLSAGRTHGYGFIHEAVVQMRGEGASAR